MATLLFDTSRPPPEATSWSSSAIETASMLDSVSLTTPATVPATSGPEIYSYDGAKSTLDSNLMLVATTETYHSPEWDLPTLSPSQLASLSSSQAAYASAHPRPTSLDEAAVSTEDPRKPLWVSLEVLSGVIMIIVLVLIWFAWRRRRSPKSSAVEEFSEGPYASSDTSSRQHKYDRYFSNASLSNAPIATSEANQHLNVPTMVPPAATVRSAGKPNQGNEVGWSEPQRNPLPYGDQNRGHPMSPPSSPTLPASPRHVSRKSSARQVFPSTVIELDSMSPVSPLSEERSIREHLSG